MAIIQCKMCGAPLPLTPGVTIVTCESCQVQQTVPAADNEKKLMLFNRAEQLRAACDFDKAAGVFEAIVAEFPNEAEAYWGLVLCKFGIEYVDDPTAGKKVPTCHRSSFMQVLDDPDFKQAVEHADVLSRQVYYQEASRIEEIRKRIIEVSNREAPYDIFICYKETDPSGRRTLDSVIAQDIYDMLTGKGYRVFFSRMTLRDKLGQEYEPYIFAALNSAKIMLVIGTNAEYYNAVWVKNEWSRYLKLMGTDHSKRLFPVYKGIAAYDLPQEFQRLQALNYGELGADQDLMMGIEKIIPKAKPAPVAQPNPAYVSQPTVQKGGVQEALTLIKQGMKLKAIRILQEAHGLSVKEAYQWANAAEQGTILPLHKPSPAPETAPAPKVTPTATAAPAPVVAPVAEKPAEKKDYYDLQQKAIPLQHLFHEGKMLRYDGAIIQYSCEADGRSTLMLNAREPQAVALNGNYIFRHGSSVICQIGDYRTKAELYGDGTVKTWGWEDPGLEQRVSGWKDIKEILIYSPKTIMGLRKDGTVVYAHKKEYGGDMSGKPFNGFTTIQTGCANVWGLRPDGTVACWLPGNHPYIKEVTSWRDIVALSAGSYQIVGLKADGTVVAASFWNGETYDVSQWRDIVAVHAASNYTMGINSQGEVFVTMTCNYEYIPGKLLNETSPVRKLPGYIPVYKLPNLRLFQDPEQVRQRYYAGLQAAPARQQPTAPAQQHEAPNVGLRKQLVQEKIALQIERDKLKGLFSGKRRKEIEERLIQIDNTLKRML